MQTLNVVFRVAVIVFGISALASLVNKLVANSNLTSWLLMQQQNLPGALLAVNIISVCTYGLAVLLISYFVARGYWWQLFPDRLRWSVLLLALVAGVLFAMFLNHPLHVFLVGVFFDKPLVSGGAVSGSLSPLTLPLLATMLLMPFVEELTDRGILFKEAEALPLWQIIVLSFLVFCFSHYVTGGMAKVLAVAPAAALFVTTRAMTGSFVYAAAAHIGMGAAALLKLQRW